MSSLNFVCGVGGTETRSRNRGSEAYTNETCHIRGVPGNLKRGRPQFPVFVSTENVGEDQKKGLFVFRRPIYPQNQMKTKKKTDLHVFCRPILPPKSSEDQNKKKGQRVLRCPVSTVSLTANIYQLIFQRRGGVTPAAPPLDTPLHMWTG